MEIVDKRLNDKGKYWRHVYKSLILLDHMLRYGSEQVVTYSKQNLYVVKTLKEFQFIDEAGRDRGLNVRQKATDVTDLLTDNEKLKRIRNGISKGTQPQSRTGSTNRQARNDNSYSDSNSQPNRSYENEEERQLKLAIQESEKEAIKRMIPENYDEDKELEKALKESVALSKNETSIPDDSNFNRPSNENASNLLLDLGDAWSMPQPNSAPNVNQMNQQFTNPNIGFNFSNGNFNQNDNVFGYNQPLPNNVQGNQITQFDQFNPNSNPSSAVQPGVAINRISTWDNGPDLLGLNMQNNSQQPVMSSNGTYNPFTNSGASSHPFSATGSFGNVFDGGSLAKPLPAGVDLSGPSAKLAEIARNSEKIDPFANLATLSSSGGAMKSTQSSTSNPFASSTSQLDSFNTGPSNLLNSGSPFANNSNQQSSTGFTGSSNTFGQDSNPLNTFSNGSSAVNPSVFSSTQNINSTQFSANPFSSTNQNGSLMNDSTQNFNMLTSNQQSSNLGQLSYGNSNANVPNQTMGNVGLQGSQQSSASVLFGQQTNSYNPNDPFGVTSNSMSPFGNTSHTQQQNLMNQNNYGNSQGNTQNPNLGGGANLFL
ncbi:Epsin-3 [Smittium mucronatum]|uniref:Epsin-3 n=1 Tax=Smittium mucronatum TaxID=133383 RepID=A0A1R0GLZ5_9FUNG|nr:Epsin-3 [Smittium mucronatum]